MGVFIVEIDFFLGGAVGNGFVVFVVGAQVLVVGDVRVEWFACCERCFQGGAFGGDFGLLQGYGAAVEVVAALTGLSALHVGGVVCCAWAAEDDGSGFKEVSAGCYLFDLICT